MSPRWSHSLFALAALALLAGGGCVTRRMTIRSNPPGATVFVDNVEIGQTPVSTDFIYYGTREIRLVKEGFETLVVKQPIDTPWYQYFPIDFVAENLVPGEIRDQREVAYQMQPTIQVPSEQLLGRGEQLRQSGRAQQAGVVVVPGAPVAAPAFAPAQPPAFAQPPIFAPPPGAEVVPPGTTPQGVLPPR